MKNKVLVDTNGYEYFKFISAEPKLKYLDGQKSNEVEVNEKGETIYIVSVLTKEKSGTKPETITVKVPSPKEPNIPEFSNVGFINLTAFAYAQNNRANISFSADKVGVLKNE